MEVYTKRLYNKILVNNFKRYKSIRVISGYASPTMVRRVIKSFPDVHILLYIGMTQEGISEQNHQDYLQITASYPNIQIYYQYKGSLNHIKLIEFYNDTDCKVYVGSANFTENGYLNQKELMTYVNFDTKQLFEEQYRDSIHCTDKDEEKYIPLYKDQAEESNFREQQLQLDNTIDNVFKAAVSYRKDSLINKVNNNYLSFFELDVMLKREYDVHWFKSGINAWVEGQTTCIKGSPKQRLRRCFPTGDAITIYLEEGWKVNARVEGNTNDELVFENIDIYLYLSMLLNLQSHRPINYEELEEKRISKLYFTRLNENEYYMSFSGPLTF